MKIMNYKRLLSFVLAVGLLLCLSGCILEEQPTYSASIQQIPDFSGEPYVVINGNQPEFSQAEITDRSFEYYADLDSLNRCGAALACIGQDIMPTQERGSIGQVKPSGWQTVKYDFVDGKYLYNRCHLIGYQLTGENANERNLITGTRYMNVEGMLPFENMVADYVKETGNHVMYRVTPVFEGEELVARGVQMEGWSVEDQGEGICFNVYVYNNQPGVIIDYTDGTSQMDETAEDGEKNTYVLNTSSRKFHKETCGQIGNIAEDNKQVTTTTRQMMINQGYEPAGCCKP